MVFPEQLYPGCKLLVSSDVNESFARPRVGTIVTFLDFVGEEGDWWKESESKDYPLIYIQEDEGECGADPSHMDGHWYWKCSWFDPIECDFNPTEELLDSILG